MPATKELLQEGRYRINQPTESFRSETVYDAYDTVRNTNVLVKEISGSNGSAAEAKKLTQLKHDSLLPVHDFFSETDRQYLVMESVDGDTLQELMKRNARAFPLSDVLAWADQLLDALNYLHTASPPVVHRGVRPENIVLGSGGRVKLLGFSTAADPAADAESCYAPLEQVWGGLDSASQNAIINSLDERAERILKEPADARSDLYALGATLYYLVTGREPVSALERAIEVFDGATDPLKEPTKLNEQIPDEVSDVLMKALELRRENRYDAAAIMRQVLKTSLLRAKDRLKSELGSEEAAAEFLGLPTAAAAASVEDELLELDAPAVPVTSANPHTSAAPAASTKTFAAIEPSDDLPSFGGSDEPANSGIGMPVIAIGAAAFVGILVAVWFFAFSGSNTPAKQAEAIPAPATQVAPVQQTQTAPAISETATAPAPTSEQESQAAAVPSSSEPASAERKSTATKNSPSAAPTPKEKKPAEAPAKAPAKEKKTVTVDDLING